MLIRHCTLATLTGESGYGLIGDGAVAVNQGKITWVGKDADIPDNYHIDNTMDGGGRLLTPGLIDCHTHIVYAGNRAAEFELRLEGASYEEIARNGGGIVSTVKSVRQASVDELVEESLPRVQQLMAEGVTTLEIKSGYGLDTDNEIKMLEAARQIGELTGIRVVKTFLGAHALPEEFTGRKDDYVDLVCAKMLPAAHERGLVDAVDGFAEGIAFSVDQVARVFAVAEELGLPVKLHAEQLSDLKGAVMAAEHGALSVDHLEYLEPNDAAKLADAGTVAVMLPGAFYFLGEARLPPMDALRDNNVPLAVATDCNPGSSPLNSLLLAMNMACTLFRMTPMETLRGVTINAARALGLADSVGSIELGKCADLVLWDTDNPAMLSYNMGYNPCHKIMVNGRWL